MGLYNELKRRNVFRVGIAYLLGAWVLLQGADFGLQVIDAPNWDGEPAGYWRPAPWQ
jgi:hypothetical protein